MRSTIRGGHSLYVFSDYLSTKKTACLRAPFEMKMERSNIVLFAQPQKYLQRVYPENLGDFAVGGG